MLKYIKQWINHANETQKELNEMGITVIYSPVPMNPIQPFYIDRERYKQYINDRQKQISKCNNQSKI